MRASCSSNISESLNHSYSMIPIDIPYTCLFTSFSSLCRECCIFSYTPSTPQLSTQPSTTKKDLISPKQKTLSCWQPESSSIFSRKIYQKNLTGRGSLFSHVFFQPLRSFRYPRCGNMPSFFFG